MPWCAPVPALEDVLCFGRRDSITLIADVDRAAAGDAPLGDVDVAVAVLECVVDEDVEDLGHGRCRPTRRDRFGGRHVQLASTCVHALTPAVGGLTRALVQLHRRGGRHRVAGKRQQVLDCFVDAVKIVQGAVDDVAIVDRVRGLESQAQ